MLAALPMATDCETLFLGFIPRVHTSLIVQPWLHLRRIVGENRKCGHTVISIVLILIVAPDHAEIGLEFIQLPARAAKPFAHVAAIRIGMPLAFVGSPLSTHGLRPVVYRTQMLWQGRVGQAYLDAPA